MKLRQLEIWNFRGIKELTWCPDPGFNLLLGAGDSCKTTILDAIDYVLGARMSLAFTDADFYNSDTTNPIRIRATVGELPKKTKADLRFETHYRGWRDGELHDEPEDGEENTDEPVLTIQLEVTDILEPAWEVWTERDVDIRPPFRPQDRELLGAVRIGAYIDRHLSWGRGSALSQYSDAIDNLNPIFAQVRRDTQSSFDQQEIPALRSITRGLSTQATAMGVQMTSSLKPGLEVNALQSSSAAVALFDGSIPTRQMGLGSRRLLVTTMQLEKAAHKSLLLVDEIESALEPHRIRKLVRALTTSGLQVIASTHSPIPVQESTDQTIHFIRRSDGAVSLRELPQEVRSNLKKSPYAALARRVLVCEGKTEEGFLGACKPIWDAIHGVDLDALGIAEAYGEGQPNGGKLALAFANLGVSTGFYYDADRGPGFTPQTAEAAKLQIFPCPVGFNAERSLFASIEDGQTRTLLEHLVESGRVLNLREVLDEFFNMPGDTSILWDETVTPKSPYTSNLDALCAASKGNRGKEPNFPDINVYWNPWLKDAETARVILKSLCGEWDEFKETQLGKVLERIRVWCYGA